MKIQSVSDIITNSSSEVFIKYDMPSLKAFKDTMQQLINAAGGNINLDDAIEIIPECDDIKCAINCWQCDKGEDRVPTDDEMIKYLYENVERSFKISERCYPIVDKLTIKAKSPEYENLANLMQYFVKPFESKELYC